MSTPETGTPVENQALHNRATSTSTSIPAQTGNIHYIYVDQHGQPVQQPVPVQVVYVDSNGQVVQPPVSPTTQPQQVVVPSQNVVPSQQVVLSTSPTNSGINNGSITGTISNANANQASVSWTNNNNNSKIILMLRIAGAVCGALATLFFGVGISNNELSSGTLFGLDAWCGWDGLHIEANGEEGVTSYSELCAEHLDTDTDTDSYCGANNAAFWTIIIMAWAGFGALLGTIFIQPLCSKTCTGCNPKSQFVETTILGIIALLIWTLGDDGGCGQLGLGSTMNLDIAGFVFAAIAAGIGIYVEHLQK